MDITATGISEGSFSFAISLRERLSDGTLNRIYLTRSDEFDNGNYDNFLHELFCLSEKSEVITVSFSFQSKAPASIKIENLSVGLFE